MADFSMLGAIQPPFSLDAEQSVLGSILLDPICISSVSEAIKPEYFYSEQNRAVYETMLNMFSAGTPIDAVTTVNALKGNANFASPEDIKVYVVGLMQTVPSAGSVSHYCKIVEDKYYKRTLITVSEDIIVSAKDDAIDSTLLLDSAEQKIFDVRNGKDIGGLVPLKEAIHIAYQNLNDRSGPDKEQFEGLKTGFPGLDDITGGLNKANLIVLAARPGLGKTSFALNIAINVAKKYRNKAVAIFSLEMSKEELALRVLSSEALVDSDNIQKCTLNQSEWNKLYNSAEYIKDLNVLIDDTSASNVIDMKGKLRRVKNLGFVVIDYLQLMSNGKPSENRVAEVSAMTRSLKIMAKELNVPILILSQLNRDVEKRSEDHRPRIADLRESGSIEQDADVVMFLYREQQYNPSANPADAECIVSKNRHGRTGKIDLRWDGNHTRFFNPEVYRIEDEEQPYEGINDDFDIPEQVNSEINNDGQ